MSKIFRLIVFFRSRSECVAVQSAEPVSMTSNTSAHGFLKFINDHENAGNVDFSGE